MTLPIKTAYCPGPDIVVKTGGYRYTMLKRNGDFAILKGVNRYGSTTYEVIRIRVRESDLIYPGGAISPAGTEYLPSTSEWGSHGWTAWGLEDAERLLKVRSSEHRNEPDKFTSQALSAADGTNVPIEATQPTPAQTFNTSLSE